MSAPMYDLKKMVAHAEKNCEMGCGPFYGFEKFTKDFPCEAFLRMQDLGIEVDDRGGYSMYDHQGEYHDFLDDTRDQTLEQMLDKQIKEWLADGV